MYNAQRAHGHRSGHRFGTLLQRVAAPSATLRDDVRTGHRPHRHTVGLILRPDRAGNALAGTQRDRGREHGSHVGKRQGAGTGHAVCSEGNVGMDILRLHYFNALRTHLSIQEEKFICLARLTVRQVR